MQGEFVKIRRFILVIIFMIFLKNESFDIYGNSAYSYQSLRTFDFEDLISDPYFDFFGLDRSLNPWFYD